MAGAEKNNKDGKDENKGKKICIAREEWFSFGP